MKAVGAVLGAASLILGAALWGSGSLSSSKASAMVTVAGGGGTSQPVYGFGALGGRGGVSKFTRYEHKYPTKVKGIPSDVVEIATSNSDSYALTSRGTVWAWGAGLAGELGNGRRPKVSGRPVEVKFPTGTDIISLPNPMPYDSALAIDSTGHVWGWGYDSSHSLCLNKLRIDRPRRLPLSRVTMATGAGGHSMFLSKGRLYSCGVGGDGELGDGTTRTSQTPVRVIGLPARQVASLQSAWQDSGVLYKDGTYYDWGYNALGQLGDGTTSNSSVPVEVALPGKVVAVSQGGSRKRNGQTLALLSNGTIWDWGANHDGQLGNGSTRTSTLPIEVHFEHKADWVEVCSGGYSSYAVARSGRAWAWGGNNYGQLGTGGSSYQKTPARVRGWLGQLSSTAANVAALGPDPSP